MIIWSYLWSDNYNVEMVDTVIAHCTAHEIGKPKSKPNGNVPFACNTTWEAGYRWLEEEVDAWKI